MFFAWNRSVVVKHNVIKFNVIRKRNDHFIIHTRSDSKFRFMINYIPKAFKSIFCSRYVKFILDYYARNNQMVFRHKGIEIIEIIIL